jgi:hypothetical protein
MEKVLGFFDAGGVGLGAGRLDLIAGVHDPLFSSGEIYPHSV